MTQGQPKSSKSGDIHFLIVDDDRESRGTIAEYLKSMGHQKITEARDGTEAVTLIDRDPSINFIISDWDMPLMNGLTLLQRIKSNPTRSHLPFLIVTSPISQESQKIVLAAESLVDAYIIKPFRSQILREKIDSVLSVSVRGPQKRVVVVDDDADAREMVIEYLKKMGFRDVIGLVDGKSGVLYLSQHSSEIGLIVSDWEMPEVTGVELLRAVKAHPVLGKVPFLMITSQSSIERMKLLQAVQSNVDEYLLKPFTLEAIKSRVERVIERSRVRDEVRVLVTEGCEHFDRGQYQIAERKFEAALQLDSKDEIALRGMGDISIKTKGVETAMQYYRKAVEVNPANAKSYLRLSAAYEQIGWHEKALHLLESAVKQAGFNADLHFELGKMYLKKNQLALAKSEFEKTLEIQLDHSEARLMLGMIRSKGKSE